MPSPAEAPRSTFLARHQPSVLAVACFLTLAAVFAFPARKYERGLVRESRDRVAGQLGAYGAALSAAVTQRLALVIGVHAFVQHDRIAASDPRSFSAYAASVYASAPGIRAIQLIRDDVIRATYPLAGNEPVLGLNLARDPRERVRAEYFRALRRRQIAISGPLELKQGGQGLIARLAVVDGHHVWGAVAVIVDVPALLRQVHLEPSSGSIVYALRDGTGQVFAGRASVFRQDPIVRRVELQDGAWDLAAVPRGGWTHINRRLWTFRILSAALLVLAALVIYLIARGLAAREEQARAVERRQYEVLRKALRVIGHEVNNTLAPVTSLIFSARQMTERPEMLPRLGQALDVIRERTDHLRGFLDRYVQLAKLPPPSPQPVALKPFLDELAILYPFRLSVPVPAVPIAFDRDQIQQVLINLLKNARESGSPPEQIELAVTVERGIAFTVLDRGCGMSPEDLARAAEPFFTTKSAGTGLGLHLSREIARAHGGTFDLSPREGGGLAARVWLPPTPEHARPARFVN